MEQAAFSWAPVTRRCTKCDDEKPIDAFHFSDKARGKRQAWCKECVNADGRERYRTDPARRDAVIQRAREQARDPEKNREHYLRVRNDPERWAAQLERRREYEARPERKQYRREYHAAYIANPENRARKTATEREWKRRPEVHARLRRLENERRTADWERVNSERREAYRASPEAQARNIERRRKQHIEAMDGVFRVYFIESPAVGAIKIGRTRGKAAARLYTLQTGSPDTLRLLGVIRDATHDDETALHRKFKHLRMRGEWFRAAPELVEFINAHAHPDA